MNVTVASERPSSLEKLNPSGLLTLDLDDPVAAAATVSGFAASNPVDAVMGVDDRTATVAAVIAERLGLPGNPSPAVRAAGNKAEQRALMTAAGLRVPAFREFGIDAAVGGVLDAARYPCVVKPVSLSGSRGVIRANNPAELRRAWNRTAGIIRSALPGRITEHRILVEAFVGDREIAVEGLLNEGRFHLLGMFDKPDPLAGPFFEETIYLTPSGAAPALRDAAVSCVASAALSLGLRTGPVHAEVRFGAAGPWLIELAARPIGGRCSAVLRFDDGSTLEQILILHALGRLERIPSPPVAPCGVLMIPTPRRGILRAVRGVGRARDVPGIVEVVTTVFPGQELIPLPEGARYVGFVFARGDSLAAVDAALRTAHRHLEIEYEDPGPGPVRAPRRVS